MTHKQVRRFTIAPWFTCMQWTISCKSYSRYVLRRSDRRFCHKFQDYRKEDGGFTRPGLLGLDCHSSPVRNLNNKTVARNPRPKHHNSAAIVPRTTIISSIVDVYELANVHPMMAPDAGHFRSITAFIRQKSLLMVPHLDDSWGNLWRWASRRTADVTNLAIMKVDLMMCEASKSTNRLIIFSQQNIGW